LQRGQLQRHADAGISPPQPASQFRVEKPQRTPRTRASTWPAGQVAAVAP